MYAHPVHGDVTNVQASVKEGIRRAGAVAPQGLQSTGSPNSVRPLNQEGEAIRSWAKQAIENTRLTGAPIAATTANPPQPSPKVPPGAIIHWRDDGTPRRIQIPKPGQGATRTALPSAASAPTDRVLTFLDEYRDLFRLGNLASELALIREENDAIGYHHFRFEQRYEGLRVVGRELMAHVDIDGHLTSVESTLAGTPGVASVVASLEPDRATTLARARIPGGNMATNSAPELVIYSAEGELPRLAWSFDVVLGLAKAWRVVVDAETGKTLSQESRVMDQSVSGRGVDLLNNTRNLNVWRSGSTYYMIDSSKPSFDARWNPLVDPRGAIVVWDAKGASADSLDATQLPFITSSSPTSWLVKDGVSAAYGLSQVHDYYRLRHARSSYDGNGGTLFSVVRVGFDNASWNGAAGIMMLNEAAARGASPR
jgi:Zn-dependent metalloprotease